MSRPGSSFSIVAELNLSSRIMSTSKAPFYSRSRGAAGLPGAPPEDAADTSRSRPASFPFFRLSAADRDHARLLRLGDLTHQIDVQEPVVERGAFDLDVIRELERALEGTRRDALIKDFAARLLVAGLFLALDRQRVFLRFDRKVVFAKARNGNRDPIGVLASALDIIGRIARG